jgi:dolichol-phosphate mannosyltransferase
MTAPSLSSPASSIDSARGAISARDATVVIPTFNERDNIPGIVQMLLRLYPDIHILVVDDRSPDGTADAVRQLQPKCANLMLMERIRNPGFAPSYRDGFRRMLSEDWCEALIMMDADFSHDPAEIGPMLDKLSDHDVVVGSRYIAGGGVNRWSFRRRLLSRGANFYVRTALRLGIHDVTSGFSCMRRQALEKIPFEKTASEGYAFQVELKYLFRRAGCRIAEHPIVFDERREGQSKMSAGKIWESIWMPWNIRLRSTLKAWN